MSEDIKKDSLKDYRAWYYFVSRLKHVKTSVLFRPMAIFIIFHFPFINFFVFSFPRIDISDTAYWLTSSNLSRLIMPRPISIWSYSRGNQNLKAWPFVHLPRVVLRRNIYWIYCSQLRRRWAWLSQQLPSYGQGKGGLIEVFLLFTDSVSKPK